MMKMMTQMMEQGADFEITVTVRNKNNVPLNLLGYSAESEVRKHYSSTTSRPIPSRTVSPASITPPGGLQSKLPSSHSLAMLTFLRRRAILPHSYGRTGMSNLTMLVRSDVVIDAKMRLALPSASLSTSNHLMIMQSPFVNVIRWSRVVSH